jgi:hypothetical protein
MTEEQDHTTHLRLTSSDNSDNRVGLSLKLPRELAIQIKGVIIEYTVPANPEEVTSQRIANKKRNEALKEKLTKIMEGCEVTNRKVYVDESKNDENKSVDLSVGRPSRKVTSTKKIIPASKDATPSRTRPKRVDDVDEDFEPMAKLAAQKMNKRLTKQVIK